MRKILASDFDNTLFFKDEGGYRQEDIDAIRKFQQDGNAFGLNTGRASNTTGVWNENADQISFDFRAGDTGAYIFGKEGNVIYQNPIPFADLKKVADLAEKAGKSFVMVSSEGNYIMPEQLIQMLHLPLKGYSSIDQFKDSDIYGFTVPFLEPGHSENFCHQINDMNLGITGFQNGDGVDFAIDGCSKASALETLTNRFRTDMDHIYAIGDGKNDIPAIKAARIGFAMADGDPEAIEAADVVVESVAQALKIIEQDYPEDGFEFSLKPNYLDNPSLERLNRFKICLAEEEEK